MVEEEYCKGSMVVIKQECSHCNYCRRWYSQPLIGNTPAGNILLSGAILFCGLSYTKVLRAFESINIAAISSRTFQEHATAYLQPTIWHCWSLHQQSLLDLVKNSGAELVLGGDGRADSPGHSAKYLSYTMMELRHNKIIDLKLIQVCKGTYNFDLSLSYLCGFDEMMRGKELTMLYIFQSNEVGGSTYMEKEGLIRCVRFLEGLGLSIGSLITDRHPVVQKWVRENLPNTNHFYDVWHVAKGKYIKQETL